jgi:hypothetical protein
MDLSALPSVIPFMPALLGVGTLLEAHPCSRLLPFRLRVGSVEILDGQSYRVRKVWVRVLSRWLFS